MTSITIAVKSEEFETINIELSSEEVTALYNLRKEQTAKIAELEKTLETEQRNHKYARGQADLAQAQLDHANTLLTALGIPEKTNHEESYCRKDLPVSTRIALYIAKVKEL